MKLKFAAGLFLASLLTACGTAQPTIQYVPQQVKVPVPVYCQPGTITKPQLTFNLAKKTDTLFKSLGYLAIENDNQAAYILKLEAALKGCQGPTVTTQPESK